MPWGVVVAAHSGHEFLVTNDLPAARASHARGEPALLDTEVAMIAPHCVKLSAEVIGAIHSIKKILGGRIVEFNSVE